MEVHAVCPDKPRGYGVETPGQEEAGDIRGHVDGGADFVLEGRLFVDADSVRVLVRGGVAAAEGDGSGEAGDAGADDDDIHALWYTVCVNGGGWFRRSCNGRSDEGSLEDGFEKEIDDDENTCVWSWRYKICPLIASPELRKLQERSRPRQPPNKDMKLSRT